MGGTASVSTSVHKHSRGPKRENDPTAAPFSSFLASPEVPAGRTGKQGELGLAFQSSQTWRPISNLQKEEGGQTQNVLGVRTHAEIAGRRGRGAQRAANGPESAPDDGEGSQPIRAWAPPPCLVRAEVGKEASLL